MQAALPRMAASSLSFALWLAHLSIFPFHMWGMTALIGIGAIAITIAVVRTTRLPAELRLSW